MKKLVFTVAVLVGALSFTSCATSSASIKNEKEVAGYTLKNKKELFEHKVTEKSNKTVIATP